MNLPCVEACCTICVETINAADHRCTPSAEPRGQHGTAPCCSCASLSDDSVTRKQRWNYLGGNFTLTLAWGGSFTLVWKQKSRLVESQNIYRMLVKKVSFMFILKYWLLRSQRGHFGASRQCNSTRECTLPLQEWEVITGQKRELVIHEMTPLIYVFFFFFKINSALTVTCQSQNSLTQATNTTNANECEFCI